MTTSGCPAVHPRGCGERVVIPTALLSTIGSSPRVRGTARSVRVVRSAVRFIPAGAGNGQPWALSLCQIAVHPRGCGERCPDCGTEQIITGSSPRVRGTVNLGKEAKYMNRFIPAGAGNGFARKEFLTATAVHPRGCGERPWAILADSMLNGSSPRVRGTEVGIRGLATDQRFIPAGAGNGATNSKPPCSATVHPRGCGERESGVCYDGQYFGSSPRVRGTERQAVAVAFYTRFIPAGAGNGCRVHLLSGGMSVHPRGCGEREMSRSSDIASCGSSPRVRGTVRPPHRQDYGHRFIPAGAGNGRKDLFT